MQDLSFSDRLVLFAANLFVWLRHPWLSLSFWYRRRRPPLFATPRGVSELVQWRKVFDHSPLFPVVVDKLRVKEWARERVPGLSTAEVVWSGTSARDIPAEFLQPGFVAKTNNGTHANYFPHRQPLPRHEVNTMLDGWLARRPDREAQWAYGQVPPKLMVERLLAKDGPLLEMTFRCCGGRGTTAYVYLDQKTPTEQRACFTADGHRLAHERGLPPSRRLPDDFRVGPEFFEARGLAEKLSVGLDFVRVDFIYSSGACYLCEMTLYPDSGFGDEHRTHTAERIYLGWIDALELAWFFTAPQPWPARLYIAALKRWRLVRQAELAREA